jgi:hypothetical protein
MSDSKFTYGTTDMKDFVITEREATLFFEEFNRLFDAVENGTVPEVSIEFTPATGFVTNLETRCNFKRIGDNHNFIELRRGNVRALIGMDAHVATFRNVANDH